MAGQALFLLSSFSFILCVVFLPAVQCSEFFDASDLFDYDTPAEDYSDSLDSDLGRILYVTVKRDTENNAENTCIARGGSCDDRPNECCNYTACRCNLWGGNCRCHRRALFQKWGK